MCTQAHLRISDESMLHKPAPAPHCGLCARAASEGGSHQRPDARRHHVLRGDLTSTCRERTQPHLRERGQLLSNALACKAITLLQFQRASPEFSAVSASERTIISPLRNHGMRHACQRLDECCVIWESCSSSG